MSQAGIINVIEGNPTIPIIFDADTGFAVALFNTINILGAGGITTSASGNTITINGSALGAQTITGNTGGPLSPTAGNWNIITANSTVTQAGAGSTLTLDFGLENLILGSSAGSIVPGAPHNNVGVGLGALNGLTTGDGNIAIGVNAMNLMSTGQDNIAIGESSLSISTNSARNIAIGDLTLSAMTSGSDNVAIGVSCLVNCVTGTGNVCLGSSSLRVGTGSNNVAIGSSSLVQLISGQSNLAVGTGSGSSYTTSESFNLVIGNVGVGGESNTLRLGNAAQHTSAFISGITGVTVTGPIVNVSSTGQLGALTEGTNNQFLKSNGAGVSPTWAAVSLTTSVTGTLPVANGGTGVASQAAYSLVAGGTTTTGAFQAVGPVTSGQLLQSAGTGALPAFTGSPSVTGSITAATGITATSGNIVATAGNITIPATTSSVGQIVQAGARLMHTFGTNNLFVGTNAGNFTLTGTENAGIGNATLTSLTNGISNMGLGYGCLTNLTSGQQNTAMGRNALLNLVTGSNNTCVGYQAGQSLTTSDSGNICIGAGVAGTTGNSNVTRIGSSQTSCFIAGITGVTVSASAPVGVNSSGQLSSLGFGTTGQVLTSTGAASSPTWQNPITATTANSSVASGSAISLTTATNANLTSISLAAGTWAVSCLVEFGGTPTVSGAQQVSISTTSVTHSTLGDNSAQAVWLSASFTVGNLPVTVPSYVLTVGSTTTVYLVVSGVFSAGNMTAYGRISAFRIA